MNQIIKALLRPDANRYYSNKKSSIFMYALQYLPLILIGVYGAVFVDELLWIVLAGIVLCGFIDYVVFDAYTDKLRWRLLYSRFYSEEAKPHTPEQEQIKTFEQNPSPENYEKLKKHLRK